MRCEADKDCRFKDKPKSDDESKYHGARFGRWWQSESEEGLGRYAIRLRDRNDATLSYNGSHRGYAREADRNIRIFRCRGTRVGGGTGRENLKGLTRLRYLSIAQGGGAGR